MKLYQRIAQAMDAHARVNDPKRQFTGAPEWKHKHKAAADALCRILLPSGCGIDNGTKIDWDRANAPKRQFVLIVDYHNMDEHGGYDGWGTYKVTITANLAFEFDIHITGGQRKYAASDKDFLADTLSDFLNRDVPEDQWKKILESV